MSLSVLLSLDVLGFFYGVYLFSVIPSVLFFLLFSFGAASYNVVSDFLSLYLHLSFSLYGPFYFAILSCSFRIQLFDPFSSLFFLDLRLMFSYPSLILFCILFLPSFFQSSHFPRCLFSLLLLCELFAKAHGTFITFFPVSLNPVFDVLASFCFCSFPS